MKFLNIIKDPVASINDAKKKNMNNTLFILFASSVLFGLSFLLTLKQFDSVIMLTSFLSVFILLIVGELVISVVSHVFMKTILSRGSYYEALTSNVYSLPALSLGMLLFSLLSFIPIVGLLAGALVLMIAIALSISTTVRAFKELYKTDVITVYVCMVLVFVSLILTVYFAMIGSLLNYPTYMMGV